MHDETTTEGLGPVDHALEGLSLPDKARLLTRPDAWTASSPFRAGLRDALRSSGPADRLAERCGVDAQVSGRALRALYRMAFDRAAVEARAWAVRSTLAAAADAGTADAAAVDAALRRLLLLALRAGLLDEPEPNAPVQIASARHALRSIAVIGERALQVRRRAGSPQVSSPMALLRSAAPGAALTWSRGTAATPGFAEIPVAQLTNPVTGCSGKRERVLADGTLEVTAQWLPVESDRIRFGVAAAGPATVLVGGAPLVLDATDDGWASAELTVTEGVPVDLRIEHEPSAGGIVLGTQPAHVDAGRLIGDAVTAAARAEVAVVVLGGAPVPACQHDLVRAVVAANPRTVVLIEDLDPVPWRDDVDMLPVVDLAPEALRRLLLEARAEPAADKMRAAG